MNLTRREKLLLKILVACIAVAAVYYLIVSPIIGLTGSTEDDVKKNIDDAGEYSRR